MKNIEIVNHINNINEFIRGERESGIAKLNVSCEFRIQKSLMILLQAYEPYETCLVSLKEKYKGKEESNEFLQALNELKNENQDIDLSNYMISEADFNEGTTLADIQSLKFMIQ